MITRRFFASLLAAAALLPAIASGQLVNPGAQTIAARDGLTGPTWSPLDLGPSLIAWWDAERSDLITRDGSGFVSSWRDVVAGYDAVQAAAGSQPVYSATGFNGRPVVTGDGVAQQLTISPVPAGIPVGAAGSELWGAVDSVAPVEDALIRIIVGYGAGSTANRFLYRTVTGGAIRASAAAGDGAAQRVSSNTGLVFLGRHVVRAAFSGTTVQADIDGIAGPSTAGTHATTTNTFRLFGGSGSSSVNLFSGGANSLLVTVPLTAPQIANLTAFLAGRTGP